MSDSAKLFQAIKARKHWIIIVTLIVAFFSILHFSRVPFVYQSTASFFVDDDAGQGLQFNESDRYSLVLAKAANGNRLYHLAKSTEMFDYLIKKFNLYNHYNVDTNSPLHYESVSEILRDNINIQATAFNAMSITVKDIDRTMAAGMANEIFKNLDQMNKDFIISNVEKKIKIYDQLLSGVKKQSLEQGEELKKLVDECKDLVGRKNRLLDENTLITDLKVNLALLSSRLSSVNDDLMQTVKVYEISAAALQKENLPNLRLINIALPDARSPANNAVSWTFALSFATLCLMITIIVLFHEYESRLRAIFS
ncbi:MAG: hypothetical protein ABI723_25250 [Bacteroidia bacterium]